MSANLSFGQLRAANVDRLPQFKNARGEPAHSTPDGSDWKLSAWSNAVAGEVGESANIIKKVERGDITLDDARQALADEFADIATYLDLMAFRAGVDLGAAVVSKFNRVSERVNATTRLSCAGAVTDAQVDAACEAYCDNAPMSNRGDKLGVLMREHEAPELRALMRAILVAAGGAA